jgi:hypothetical protein
MPHSSKPGDSGRTTRQEGDTDEVSKKSDAATEIDRRTLLRTATATAVGGAGLAASTSSAAAGNLTSGDCEEASAPSDFPRVSTREHFDDDANLINGESAWSYDVEGGWPGSWGEDTLTLFIHGWLNSNQEALDGGYETKLALKQEGYGGDAAVFTWDSDKGGGIDQGWGESKEIAQKNGRKLANFTQWYSRTYGVDVRWIGHSLGAEVVLYGLQSLDDDYGLSNQVKSVTFLGGAVENDDVSTDAGWWDDEFGDHIEFAAETCDNFYSTDDEVLEWIFETWEFDGALGDDGIEGPAPYNYTDHNVTDIVPTHYDYNTRGCGCIGQVVDAW